MFTQTRPSIEQSQASTAPVIVVGYDGLQASRNAVEVAAERAGPDGTLVVVHVAKPVSSWMGKPYRDHAIAENRMDAVRNFSKLATADLGTVTIENEVIEGDPAEALIRIARGRNADEIVVGSRGLGRFRAMLGSVSHRLLEHADRPVVIVPGPAEGS